MGAHPVAQESAGEVIKENGSLGGGGGPHNGFHFLIGNKSPGVMYTCTCTHTDEKQIHMDTRATTATH